MASNLRSENAKYTFRFMGKQGNFYAYRAPIWNTVNRKSLDAQQFEAELVEWFFNNAKEIRISSFKEVDGYYSMPHAFNDAKSICVLLEENEIISFEQNFNISRSGLFAI